MTEDVRVACFNDDERAMRSLRSLVERTQNRMLHALYQQGGGTTEHLVEAIYFVNAFAHISKMKEEGTDVVERATLRAHNGMNALSVDDLFHLRGAMTEALDLLLAETPLG